MILCVIDDEKAIGVLKYSPNWSGAGEMRQPIWIPDVTYEISLDESFTYGVEALISEIMKGQENVG